MNSKLLFTLFAIASVSLYVYSEDAGIDVKKKPERRWREQRDYVYDQHQLTKPILTNFLQLCEKENILKDSEDRIDQIEISKDKKSSYAFTKTESYIQVNSVFEAREWKDADQLKETWFETIDVMHSMGIIRDKCTTCKFIALYNYATYQPTIIVSCDTNIDINDPNKKALVEKIAQEVAAEKQQAKEKHEQSAKDQATHK